MIIGWIGQLAVLEKGFVKSRSLLGHFPCNHSTSGSQKVHKRRDALSTPSFACGTNDGILQTYNQSYNSINEIEMSNTQYAVCHLQRGSGNDSGMSCHIERKDAKGKVYVPTNADANRTSQNRELLTFPNGVANRTEAIQYRIDTAGLHRKVAKNQTKAIRIILTGTHEQMMKIALEGKLGNWIDANLKWLRETFGSENLVSCVLHMDEKTPHLHATVVPIVTGERIRRKREGEKKYETKSGPRLSADDVMRRSKLHEYQNNYAKAMKPFGLQRGIVGSTAKHQAKMYRSQCFTEFCPMISVTYFTAIKGTFLARQTKACAKASISTTSPFTSESSVRKVSPVLQMPSPAQCIQYPFSASKAEESISYSKPISANFCISRSIK